MNMTHKTKRKQIDNVLANSWRVIILMLTIHQNSQNELSLAITFAYYMLTEQTFILIWLTCKTINCMKLCHQLLFISYKASHCILKAHRNMAYIHITSIHIVVNLHFILWDTVLEMVNHSHLSKFGSRVSAVPKVKQRTITFLSIYSFLKMMFMLTLKVVKNNYSVAW